MNVQVAGEANLRLEDSLACLRCSAAAVQFVSHVAASLYREERHSTRS